MLTYFPRIQRCAPPASAVLRNFPDMTKNSPPTVLVVDDEALIRWSLAEMLGDRGYTVTEAADGRTAVAAIQGATEPFDVCCWITGCRILLTCGCSNTSAGSRRRRRSS